VWHHDAADFQASRAARAEVACQSATHAEVVRWEALVQDALRMEVSNEKTLQRAKTALEECAGCEQTLATRQRADEINIAKEADALEQQIQSVRNKVLVAHRNVAARAPS
jgi:hypothetical protein